MSKAVENAPNTSESDAAPLVPLASAENTVQSVNVLIQSAIKGQRAGAYTLEEASVIMDSIKFLQKNMGEQPK